MSYPLARQYSFLKRSSAFTSAAYIQVYFGLEFIMEAMTTKPDQTAPFSWEQSDQGA